MVQPSTSKGVSNSSKRSKCKKRKRVHPDENGEYVVAKISKIRNIEDDDGHITGREYYVHWKGFKHATWEPYDNVKDTVALTEFNQKNCIEDSIGSNDGIFGVPLNNFESVLFGILTKYYYQKQFDKDTGFYS